MTRTARTRQLEADNPRGPRRPASLAFLINGVGNSNQGFDPHPYETFAYDSALVDAQIGDFNITPYGGNGFTSVIPSNMQVIYPIGELADDFHHGGVLECVMPGIGVTYSAVAAKGNIGIRSHGRISIHDSDGPVSSAAACIGWALVRSSPEAPAFVLIAEWTGHWATPIGSSAAQEVAHTYLSETLINMALNRGVPITQTPYLADVSYVEVNSTNKLFGYALNGIGFVDFVNLESVQPSG